MTLGLGRNTDSQLLPGKLADVAGVVDAVGTIGAAVTGALTPDGIISQQVSLAGVGNAADTTDDVLFTYSMPANAFDKAGRGVEITAFGKYAANGNNKTVKLWFGATVVATTGVVTTNNNGFMITARVFKAGAVASNTQIGQSGTNIALPTTPTETESGAIVIKLTGASGTTGAANDVIGQNMQVKFLN